jgi:zinc/manganese transport system substrate-binding protein
MSLKIISKIMLVGLLFSPNTALAEPLKVVASFSILADIAREIGGDKIALTTLVGPNSDAHVYEPKPADAVAMSEADIVLTNGLGFEGFIERLAKTSATKAQMVTTSAGVYPIKGEGDEADKNDPHAFQSIPNVRLYVTNITDAFCAMDAANCAEFKASAGAYDAKLVALDTDIRDSIATIPEANRTIITSHDAFGYFAHEYGLTFLAPEGISTDSEASAAGVAALIDQIKSSNASALFIENMSDPRLINEISAETGIAIGGSLFADALSTADGPAATYVELMKSNVATIRAAILGE